ncbi:MAG: (2Fe-2S)-binding protein [Sulfurimonas sp.]|jgi:ferredoxin|nr:(2Fe-2S)-binding protein [Sulfurimonas sp.]MBU1216116.1 (2Fe-2S)-binding protein [bacterium]MBU1434422.1 (2Fe-2S)-binding protein [bacterium]MBU1502000.1 (2Fe-2S)-binding protein [bacterium]MBU3939649.1 (2Fe-2S)-binding protein [bacterium]
MVSVYLKNDNIKVNVKTGKSMREIARKSGASMEFGCRVGDCSTCIAKIVHGADLLNPINDKELLAIKAIGSKEENLRLMCQCIVEADEGEIEISYFF